ncbi:hypothetical protein [Kaarinaea lacus]
MLCGDVSDSSQLETRFADDEKVRRKAERFVYFYELLESQFTDDSVGMVHWFRKDNSRLGTTPFPAMVDGSRLEEVIVLLATLAD